MSAANWLNSGIMANQRFNEYSIAGVPVRAIGNPRPPNIGGPAGINSNMLQVASPKSYDLTQATYVDTTASDQAALNCRNNYIGRAGLAQLMIDNANNTFYDAGCGFYYNSNTGEGRGALGFNTDSAPETVYNLPGELDDTRSGTFYMFGAANGNDLNRAVLDMADKTLSSASAGGAHKCSDMQALSAANKPYYGFCTTTNMIIPIQGGNAIAMNGPKSCLPANIITATNYASCPAGFQNYEGFQGRGSQAGSSSRLGLGLSRQASLETFDNPILNCTTPLSSDCIIQAALSAGCSDNGSLAQALQGSTSTPYSQNLSKNAAYKAYQAGSGAITAATMRDGSVSVNTALSDFHDLYANMNSSNQQISAAARDLCLSNGSFESYDFCGELTDQTVIGNTYLHCIQNEFINAGGSTKGTAYPSESKYSQTTYQGFKSVLQGIVTKLNSNDPISQASAKRQLTG